MEAPTVREGASSLTLQYVEKADRAEQSQNEHSRRCSRYFVSLQSDLSLPKQKRGPEFGTPFQLLLQAEHYQMNFKPS